MVGGHPLRVAYLSGSPRISTRDDAGVSGPRAHILGLVGGLRAAGHDVPMYVFGDQLPGKVSAKGDQGSPAAGALRRLAVDVVRVGMRRAVASSARRSVPGHVDVAYERLALFQELGRRFQARGAVWVVETNSILSLEARIEHHALALPRLAARLERRTYGDADVVVAVSQPLKDMLVKHMGVPADKILVLPNGVDIDRFHADGPPAGEVGSDGELVVGFVGFVVERQGLDDLVRAVAQVRRRGTSVRAVIVGDGADLPRLRELAASEGVAESVQFLGQVPFSEVAAAISRFSVGYSGQRGVGGMPMYHSPLKIYECLAMGRPVIATDHGDARRVLGDAGAGWTFRAGDVDSLVAVLEDVASLGREGLSDSGARARRQIEQHHTWSHRADQLIEALRGRDLLT